MGSTQTGREMAGMFKEAAEQIQEFKGVMADTLTSATQVNKVSNGKALLCIRFSVPNIPNPTN